MYYISFLHNEQPIAAVIHQTQVEMEMIPRDQKTNGNDDDDQVIIYVHETG